jgi:hypothetical protein
MFVRCACKEVITVVFGFLYIRKFMPVLLNKDDFERYYNPVPVLVLIIVRKGLD